MEFNDYFQKKDIDRTFPDLRMSSQDRSDGSVGRAEIVRAIPGSQSPGGV